MQRFKFYLRFSVVLCSFVSLCKSALSVINSSCIRIRDDIILSFSAYLIRKGFKIIEVGNEEKFDEGDMAKAERDTVHIILRACKSGQPDIKDNRITVEGKSYTIL